MEKYAEALESIANDLLEAVSAIDPIEQNQARIALNQYAIAEADKIRSINQAVKDCITD